MSILTIFFIGLAVVIYLALKLLKLGVDLEDKRRLNERLAIIETRLDNDRKFYLEVQKEQQKISKQVEELLKKIKV